MGATIGVIPELLGRGVFTIVIPAVLDVGGAIDVMAGVMGFDGDLGGFIGVISGFMNFSPPVLMGIPMGAMDPGFDDAEPPLILSVRLSAK
mmetsp:Transcript_11364/g.23301  ORF Transcript_11364/g.23301 Transcript_11364/m.23301 type:complete len:91 (-) Transcript_11364:46-318(-)